MKSMLLGSIGELYSHWDSFILGSSVENVPGPHTGLIICPRSLELLLQISPGKEKAVFGIHLPINPHSSLSSGWGSHCQHLHLSDRKDHCRGPFKDLNQFPQLNLQRTLQHWCKAIIQFKVLIVCKNYRAFPGGPVAKTSSSQCWGPRCDPWSRD